MHILTEPMLDDVVIGKDGARARVVSVRPGDRTFKARPEGTDMERDDLPDRSFDEECTVAVIAGDMDVLGFMYRTLLLDGHPIIVALKQSDATYRYAQTRITGS